VDNFHGAGAFDIHHHAQHGTILKARQVSNSHCGDSSGQRMLKGLSTAVNVNQCLPELLAFHYFELPAWLRFRQALRKPCVRQPTWLKSRRTRHSLPFHTHKTRGSDKAKSECGWNFDIILW